MGRTELLAGVEEPGCEGGEGFIHFAAIVEEVPPVEGDYSLTRWSNDTHDGRREFTWGGLGDVLGRYRRGLVYHQCGTGGVAGAASFRLGSIFRRVGVETEGEDLVVHERSAKVEPLGHGAYGHRFVNEVMRRDK